MSNPDKDTDTLAVFSLRVPHAVKEKLGTLSKSQIGAMDKEIRELIKKHLYMSEFDPEKYLSD